MAENLGKYGYKTIDDLIKILKVYKKEMGGDTKIYLSDFEFNGRQTKFEVTQVEGQKELYLFYEMHEGTWYYEDDEEDWEV